MTFKHLGVKSNFGVFRFITSDEKGQSTYWVESYASENFYQKTPNIYHSMIPFWGKFTNLG